MAITREILQRSFWALPIGEVLDILETTRSGLTSEEVKERRAIFKENVLPQGPALSRLAILFRQFKSPLLALLLAAAGITIFLGDWKDAGFILAVVSANILLGFYQESKAERALADLKHYVVERARVLRNGTEMEVETRELVPGDVVHLAQGDRVPADCRIIYANDFMADEAILTGESLPVNKTTEPASFKAALGDRRSMAFSGTLVVQGFANAVVCATGYDTELGKIASMVASAEKEKTPLQKAISRFSVKVSIALVVLTILIFFLGLYTGRSLLEMFLIAVAISVAAVPEGLPVALTVILAIGVQRLAKRKGVVRKLLAAETLGNTSVILTDKTGTLTQAKMDMSEVRIFAKGYTKDEALRWSLLNTDVVIENPRANHEKWEIIGRPLEVALAKSAAREGVLLPEVKRKTEILDFLPFTSKNKFSASLTKDGANFAFQLNVFGAPDILIKHADLSDEEKRAFIGEVEKMAYGGARVLGVAIKEFKSQKEISLREKETFEGLRFIATISFRDPVRPSAKSALEKVEKAGVRTVIVTGDHRGTAEAVAKELGMHVDRDQVIDGVELEAMSDAELDKRLAFLRIVARVSPEGKMRIAQRFKKQGEVVAMTGDGINDAGPLKEADIGIAMGSGTDVAKDVSDLVLLDDNFSTIVAAIEEGRRILENIRKVIVYLATSLFDEMILIGGSLLFALALPLSAIQILFVNFIADTFPALALAFEDRADHVWEKRKRKTSAGLFDKEMIFLTLLIGIPTSAFLFVIYYFLNRGGVDLKTAQTFIFATFASYSLFVIFSVRSLRRPIVSYNFFSNPLLIVGVVLGLGALAAAVYLPFMQEIMGTAPLPPEWLGAVAFVGVFNILVIEIIKWLFRRVRLNGAH